MAAASGSGLDLFDCTWASPVGRLAVCSLHVDSQPLLEPMRYSAVWFEGKLCGSNTLASRRLQSLQVNSGHAAANRR